MQQANIQTDANTLEDNAKGETAPEAVEEIKKVTATIVVKSANVRAKPGLGA